MDGTIVNYDPKKATGIIRTKDGKEFLFRKADWREKPGAAAERPGRLRGRRR